jgi:hypothetical protein
MRSGSVSHYFPVGSHKLSASASFITKTGRHDIAEILPKVALNTIKQTNKQTNKRINEV